MVSGGPAAAVVVADPGLGKTRLLAEIVPRLGFPHVRLHGYEPAREIPFSAAAGLLRVLAGVPDAGTRLDAALFGEAAASGRLQGVRVFEAAFRCLAAYGPLAVVVDDLQWADADTLALVDYLLAATQQAQLPLLVLGASRPSAGAESVAAGFRAVLPRERFVELTLGPLPREEGVTLVRKLAPRLDRGEAEGLWERARGSPFWLETLVGESGPDAAPAALVRSRLRTVDGDAGRLFALLVTAARPLELAAAAEMFEWEEERVHAAAVALGSCALVVLEGGTARVVHDLIREAARRELPAVVQRRLHARLAEWLEAAAGDDLQLLSRALEHRQEAGLPATEIALRVARSPQRRLLGRDGLAMLDRIAAASAGEERLLLQRELAALASEIGEWEIALESWGALAERLRSPHERARAALAAALAAVRLGRAQDVYLFATKARGLAPDDALVAVEADVREGQALRWLENRIDEAQALTDRAVTEAQRLVAERGDVDALTEAERSAYIAALRAQLDAGIRAGDADTVRSRAEDIIAAARDPVEALAAESDAIFSLIMFEGLPRLAEPRARRALEQARQLVLPTLEVEATHWLGWTLHFLGRLEEAEQVAAQAVALAERVGAPERFGVPNLRAVAYAAAASRGDWQSAVAAIAAEFAESPEPHYRLNTRMAHLSLLVRFAAASADEVHQWLDAMREDAEEAACERCWWQQTLVGAEAQTRIGELDAARAALAKWDDAHATPRPGPRARRAYIEALIVGAEDPGASLPLFARAGSLVEQAGLGLLALWNDLDAAVALTRVHPARAVEALRTVVERAEAMGAYSEQRLATRELRALGVRTWRRGRDGGALTERERQIAERVAAGATNPEIAQSLFLSRKTVERHVSHILSKLGARNRVELAARLARDGEGAAG